MEGKDKKQQGGLFQRLAVILIFATAILLGISLLLSCFVNRKAETEKKEKETKKAGEPKIEEMFLTPNKYSRPQIEL